MRVRRPERLSRREALRLLPVLVPVVASGAATVAVAVLLLARDVPSVGAVTTIGAFAAAVALTETFPVRVAAFPTGMISVSAVFVVSGAVLHGTVAAVTIGFAGRLAAELAHRRPGTRVVFNSALYALCGLAAGGAAAAVGETESVGGLLAAAVAGSAAFFVVDVPLVAAIVARASRRPFVPMLTAWVGWTAASFGVMASVSLILTVLWERSPLLSVGLVGPLAATILHQRSMRDALGAMKLALTDPLTGLGNDRHFHERMHEALERAALDGTPLTLCLLDLDDFKRVNDTFGHLVGDDLLRSVAECFHGNGEAFRVGGDEFALVLAGEDGDSARATIGQVLDRLETIECGDAAITVSAGLASSPRHATELTELLRVADVALYVAKRDGKNRLQVAEDPGKPEVPLGAPSLAATTGG